MVNLNQCMPVGSKIPAIFDFSKGHMMPGFNSITSAWVTIYALLNWVKPNWPSLILAKVGPPSSIGQQPEVGGTGWRGFSVGFVFGCSFPAVAECTSVVTWCQGSSWRTSGVVGHSQNLKTFPLKHKQLGCMIFRVTNSLRPLWVFDQRRCHWQGKVTSKLTLANNKY